MSTACAPIVLAASGILSIGGGTSTSLAADAVYWPPCPVAPAPAIHHRSLIVTGGVSTDETWSDSPQFSDLRDPFYATIFPQCYALAATTVLAYMLLAMLVIAPRSFLDGGVATLGQSGFTNGNSNGINIGGRPWLQKVAALLVAVSLTIATADTFRVAEEQYMAGYQDAHKLQQRVLGGTQLKTIQLISDTFLWLAQAQTLIRLFPRQREKVIIKWTAFALITLDVIFGALNSFRYTAGSSLKPRQFTEAIPALSYLFQLSLGFLYAAWVLYYALTKKRYAFYHPLMKNISLMAALSIGALLVPVVFFVLDIAEPKFTGWGDYVRWVGAAAASVVVWEWVERIEALEREEKKDGVLGREVFDGDEMIDISPSDLTWPRGRKNRRHSGERDGGNISATSSFGGRDRLWSTASSAARRRGLVSDNLPSRTQSGSVSQTSTTGGGTAQSLQPPLWPSRPSPAMTPSSRMDTTSADSTIYRVRYQSVTETTSTTTHDRLRPSSRGGTIDPSHADVVVSVTEPTNTHVPSSSSANAQNKSEHEGGRRQSLLLPWKAFLRKYRDPPIEVQPHTLPKVHASRREHEPFSVWDIRSRIEDFTATQAERVCQRFRPTHDTDSLPVTVIPAPQRRGAALAQLLEGEEAPTGLTTLPSSLHPELSNAGVASHIAVSAPPRRLSRARSGATQPTGSSFIHPTDRNGTSFDGPADWRHPVSGMNEDRRKAAYAERRPVDDLVQDRSHIRFTMSGD
ncbi:PalH/RIM21-domain-containing protein [Xylaria sp. CBS 124048]|nr:PalH/RIM21-domain-containing protein [Xylaria sp. CBS 124048]